MDFQLEWIEILNFTISLLTEKMILNIGMNWKTYSFKGSKTLKIPVYTLNFSAPRPSIAKTSTAHKTVAINLLILTKK